MLDKLRMQVGIETCSKGSGSSLQLFNVPGKGLQARLGHKALCAARETHEPTRTCPTVDREQQMLDKLRIQVGSSGSVRAWGLGRGHKEG